MPIVDYNESIRHKPHQQGMKMSKYRSWEVILSDLKYGRYNEVVTAKDEEGAKETALFYNEKAVVVAVRELLPSRGV